MLTFAIIGSGPSALYLSKLLVKLPSVKIHLFEKELAPMGLLRYGVAPDHLSIKKT